MLVNPHLGHDLATWPQGSVRVPYGQYGSFARISPYDSETGKFHKSESTNNSPKSAYVLWMKGKTYEKRKLRTCEQFYTKSWHFHVFK